MKQRFEGWYHKHQKGDVALAIIVGRSQDEAFVQVITPHRTYHVPYPLSTYCRTKQGVIVGDNVCTTAGIVLNINTPELNLLGTIDYDDITPPAHDIMGPFRFFPMECRHTVLSMHHRLHGTLTLNGSVLDFTGGVGYLEGDSGRSFPTRYAWAQCSAFEGEGSVMLSIAKIPFLGGQFWGCIALVWVEGRMHRLATYTGARIVKNRPEWLELRQRDLVLRITCEREEGHALFAPQQGQMSRTIKENLAQPAHVYFEKAGRVLLDESSDSASLEYV